MQLHCYYPPAVTNMQGAHYHGLNNQAIRVICQIIFPHALLVSPLVVHKGTKQSFYCYQKLTQPPLASGPFKFQ